MTEPITTLDPKALPATGNRLYQKFDLEEDSARVSSHYEQDPEFFYILTGGGWHTYSCSFCADTGNMTEAQEILFTDEVFRHVVVQRSRAYARKSQEQHGGSLVVFPRREPPKVGKLAGNSGEVRTRGPAVHW